MTSRVQKGVGMLDSMINTNGISVLLIILCVVSVVLIALVIILFMKLKQQNERMDKFMKGQDGTSIEASVEDKFKRLQILEEKDAVEDEAIRDLYSRLKGAYQKTGVVRYNAFMENGGNLSFALCFLDDENNGIIMNVMNGRDGSYCYLKEIEKGMCDISLGKEEAEALDIAMYAK